MTDEYLMCVVAGSGGSSCSSCSSVSELYHFLPVYAPKPGIPDPCGYGSFALFLAGTGGCTACTGIDVLDGAGSSATAPAASPTLGWGAVSLVMSSVGGSSLVVRCMVDTVRILDTFLDFGLSFHTKDLGGRSIDIGVDA